MTGSATPTSLTIYLPDLSGGGAERLYISLAPLFIDAGYRVTFLLDRLGGDLLPLLPPGCAVHALNARRQIHALPKLVRYLRRARPDVLIANMEHMNVMAVIARALTGVPTRVVASQHSVFSEQVKRGSWQFRALPMLYRLVIPFADRVVTVSEGVADDLVKATGLPRRNISIIYNGVVTSDFDDRAALRPAHPWFLEDQPIILGMGRLVAQKGFATLIRAFARVADRSDARLVILGEGPLRVALEDQVSALGSLSERISLPGFIANPLPLLQGARLFALTSLNEGFGNVIAEALACGTPVVSTDCPYGPAEILGNGRYGRLVPVGDADALGDAFLAALGHDADRAELMRRGRRFSVARCAEDYGKLIQHCQLGAVRKPIAEEVQA